MAIRGPAVRLVRRRVTCGVMRRIEVARVRRGDLVCRGGLKAGEIGESWISANAGGLALGETADHDARCLRHRR